MTRTDVVASSRPQAKQAQHRRGRDRPARCAGSWCCRSLFALTMALDAGDGPRGRRRRSRATTRHDTRQPRRRRRRPRLRRRRHRRPRPGRRRRKKAARRRKRRRLKDDCASDDQQRTDGQKSLDAAVHGLRPSLDDRRRAAADGDGLLDRRWRSAASAAARPLSRQRQTNSDERPPGTRRPLRFWAGDAAAKPGCPVAAPA